jgi:hypothetical protein
MARLTTTILFAAIILASGSRAYSAPPESRPVQAVASRSLHTDDGCASDMCRAALEKAIDVIANGLLLRPSQSSGAAKIDKEIRKLKSCVHLPHTETDRVYRGLLDKDHAAYLFIVRGELSKSNVVLGLSCAAVIAVPPIPAVILSELVEAASKHVDRENVRLLFLPTESFPTPGDKISEPHLNNNKIQYKSATGIVIIDLDQDNKSALGSVYRSDGALIYKQLFNF